MSFCLCNLNVNFADKQNDLNRINKVISQIILNKTLVMQTNLLNLQ